MKLNKTIRLFLLLFGGLLFASCVEINGSGIKRLTKEEQMHVKVCPQELGKLTNDGILYKVNTNQIKKYINSVPNLIIYEYLPFCSGESGQTPMEVKRVCDKHNIEFLVISSVYDGILPIPQSYTFPMFVIDVGAYCTDNYQEYSEDFYKTITNSDDEDRQFNPYHYFRKGKYICSYASLADIKK